MGSGPQVTSFVRSKERCYSRGVPSPLVPELIFGCNMHLPRGVQGYVEQRQRSNEA